MGVSTSTSSNQHHQFNKTAQMCCKAKPRDFNMANILLPLLDRRAVPLCQSQSSTLGRSALACTEHNQNMILLFGLIAETGTINHQGFTLACCSNHHDRTCASILTDLTCIGTTQMISKRSKTQMLNAVALMNKMVTRIHAHQMLVICLENVCVVHQIVMRGEGSRIGTNDLARCKVTCGNQGQLVAVST